MANATSMAELLASSKKPLVTLKKGELVQATFTKLNKNEILVNLGGKGEALVLEKDRDLASQILNSFKIGDTVEVSVLSVESEGGYPVVSIRRFMEHRVWEELEKLQKDKTQLEVEVTESTKGGYTVVTESGVRAFLPHTLTTQSHGIGEKVSVTVFELLRADKKVVVTEKNMMSPDEFKAVTRSVKPGETVTGVIANITTFGVFVTLSLNGQEMEGLVHISELAWEKTTQMPEGKFVTGEPITVKVMGFDMDSKRVNLSLKQLTEDPFTKLAEKYPVDSTVKGTVTQIVAGNVHISLGDGVEGIIRKEKVPTDEIYTEGQSVTVMIGEIDMRRHRIYLSPVMLKKTIGYR